MNQALRIFYNESKPWLDVRCNDAILLERAQPVSVVNLRAAVTGDLVIAEQYRVAWQEFADKHPDFNVDANREVMFTMLHGDEPSLEAFEDILRSCRKMLTLSARAQERLNDEQERERLIKEIGPSNRDLASIPLEDLREIAATKAENERRKNLSVPELRKLALHERPVAAQPELPARYTKELLDSMTTGEMRFTIQRFGAAAVNERRGYQKPAPIDKPLGKYIAELPQERREKLIEHIKKESR